MDQGKPGDAVKASFSLDVSILDIPANAVRTQATLFMAAGIAGVILPGLPGWPLIMISISLLAAKGSKIAILDKWMTRKFPAARQEALRFAFCLKRDLDKRFPPTK
ncbi:MAG TPA: hypothetical protein VKZ53_12880 [Candidatus Angelobacter sp.]|nr:hypothetical protein [Candidatus Angelobacter sp.]